MTEDQFSLVMIIQNYKYRNKSIFTTIFHNLRPVVLNSLIKNNNTDVLKELSFLIASLDPLWLYPLLFNEIITWMWFIFDFIESYLICETSTIEEVFDILNF